MDSARRAWDRLGGAILLLGLLLSLSCAGMRPIEGSNSWRSPQPSPEELKIAAERGVKTVVCLRKGRPGSPWFEKEVAVCRELGLNLCLLEWSALDSSQAQIDRLVQILREQPPPYLIHCRAGVDRSGLAAAVFRVVALGHSKEEAGSELSIWNGHLPLFGARAMDRAWRRFRFSVPDPAIDRDEPALAGP